MFRVGVCVQTQTQTQTQTDTDIDTDTDTDTHTDTHTDRHRCQPSHRPRVKIARLYFHACTRTHKRFSCTSICLSVDVYINVNAHTIMFYTYTSNTPNPGAHTSNARDAGRSATSISSSIVRIRTGPRERGSRSCSLDRTGTLRAVCKLRRTIVSGSSDARRPVRRPVRAVQKNPQSFSAFG